MGTCIRLGEKSSLPVTGTLVIMLSEIPPQKEKQKLNHIMEISKQQ